MGQARVRLALPDDPAMLATLLRTWWRDAYPDILPGNVLNMDEGVLAESWTLQMVGATALIAEERTHPVGFALINPKVLDGVGEIELLGVIPRWSRRGHGGRLMAEAARILHEAGAETGIWWAVESDQTVADFAAGIGWGPSGIRRVMDTGEGRITEIQYSGTLHLPLDDGD